MKRFLLALLVYFNLSFLFYGQDNPDSLRVNQMIKQIDRLRQKEKYDEALQLSDKMINLSRNNDYVSYGEALLSKSKVLWSAGKFEEALKVDQQALQIADKYDLYRLKVRVWHNMAHIYQKKGEKSNAIDYINKVLVGYEKLSDRKGIGEAYQFLGGIKTELGDFEKGQEYLHKALQIHKKLKDTASIINDWNVIGYGYFNQKKYNEAKKYFLKVARNASDDNQYLFNILYLNLGTIYQYLNRLDSAAYYQNKAIKLAKNAEKDYLLAYLYFNISTVKLQQKQLDSARIFALAGLKKAQKFNKYDLMIGDYTTLYKVDSISGNIPSQIGYLRQIISLKDSVLKQERKSLAKVMETKYYNLKKDELIKLQKKNLSVVKEKNKLLTGLIIIGIILFVILLLFVVTYRKLLAKSRKLHRMEKQQMQEKIKHKEQELVAIALQVEQKNKLIDKFYNKLRKKAIDTQEKDKEIKNILKEMKTSVNLQKDVALFSEKFADLHHDFIAQIKHQYPQLSLKEIKFLSFLRVGLSNKQIAAMQNVTPAAVHKMRYRIKKKLQLDKDVSLDDFIINL
jgi:tetratricopeptide (TPR) repeat protein